MSPVSHVIIAFHFIASLVLAFEQSGVFNDNGFGIADSGSILGDAGYLNGGGILPGGFGNRGLLGGAGLLGGGAGLALGAGHVWGRDLIGPVGRVYPRFGTTGGIDTEGGLMSDTDFIDGRDRVIGGAGFAGVGDIGDGVLGGRNYFGGVNAVPFL